MFHSGHHSPCKLLPCVPRIQALGQALGPQHQPTPHSALARLVLTYWLTSAWHTMSRSNAGQTLYLYEHIAVCGDGRLRVSQSLNSIFQSLPMPILSRYQNYSCVITLISAYCPYTAAACSYRLYVCVCVCGLD